MKGKLTGGCLCGAVRYTLREGFRLNPYACHCTDCQSRTGSAFSEHMLFALAELEISGDLDTGEYDQPSGAHSLCASMTKVPLSPFLPSRDVTSNFTLSTSSSAAVASYTSSFE